MDVTSLIGSIGFPIVMCLLMYKQMGDTAESHKEEMESVTKALNNNTLVLQKLVDKIGDDNSD